MERKLIAQVESVSNYTLEEIVAQAYEPYTRNKELLVYWEETDSSCRISKY